VVSSAVLDLPTSSWTVAVARHALHGLLDAAGVAAGMGADLTIALSEACTNAVRHASAGLSYRVRLCVDDSRCLMEVRDHGAGFDPRLVPAPRVHAHDGRGLMIIRTIVDKVHIDALQPHGMRVVMVKNCSNFAERAHSERHLGRSDGGEGGIGAVVEVEQTVEGDQTEQLADLR
jgi:serine/threonine-protein kinase RsbW